MDGITAPDNSSDTGKGSIAAENAVRFTNKYIQEDIPRTDDTFIASTVLLSLLAAITLAAPILIRRRFI